MFCQCNRAWCYINRIEIEYENWFQNKFLSLLKLPDRPVAIANILSRLQWSMWLYNCHSNTNITNYLQRSFLQNNIEFPFSFTQNYMDNLEILKSSQWLLHFVWLPQVAIEADTCLVSPNTWSLTVIPATANTCTRCSVLQPRHSPRQRDHAKLQNQTPFRKLRGNLNIQTFLKITWKVGL